LPLLLWCIVTGAHRVWSGEGARRFGQRWNPPGYPAIYAGTSFALCLIEVLVHANAMGGARPAFDAVVLIQSNFNFLGARGMRVAVTATRPSLFDAAPFRASFRFSFRVTQVAPVFSAFWQPLSSGSFTPNLWRNCITLSTPLSMISRPKRSLFALPPRRCFLDIRGIGPV
jgi:hypothetical protein